MRIRSLTPPTPNRLKKSSITMAISTAFAVMTLTGIPNYEAKAAEVEQTEEIITTSYEESNTTTNSLQIETVTETPNMVSNSLKEPSESILIENEATTTVNDIIDVGKEEINKRYIQTSFGEQLDTKYAMNEEEIIALADKICKEQQLKYITTELLISEAYQESKFRKNVTNDTAVGLCQIKEQFHQMEMDLAGATDLLNAKDNLATCAIILETTAAEHVAKGYKKEDAIIAAITYYHLTRETAKEYVATGEIDDYTKTVLERAFIIAQTKDSVLELARTEDNHEIEL